MVNRLISQLAHVEVVTPKPEEVTAILSRCPGPRSVGTSRPVRLSARMGRVFLS